MYSSVVSLSAIFVALISLGVPSGVQRFLGRSFLEKKMEDSKVEISSSLFLVSAGVLICVTTIMITRDWISDIFRIDYNLLYLLVVLIGSTSIYSLLRAIIISSLKTKGLTKMTIISALARFSIAAILFSFGAISLGIALSTAIYPIMLSVLLAFGVAELLKKTKSIEKLHLEARTSLRKSIKNILAASMAGWIPNLIYIIGSQVGIVVVNGFQGASEAGLYFISFSIVTGILTIMSVLQTIAYPTLSGMRDGRKRFAWRMLKLTLVILLPLSSTIVFYSRDIVQIFGPQFLEAYSMLEIMMLSALPISVSGFISVLVYSYGNYKQVLIIGLSLSVPRVAFYFLLVPFYGGNGAAISFLLGSLAGLLCSIIIAKKINMQLLGRELTLLFGIPTALALILSYLGVSYIFGAVITIIVSYLLFLRFRILERTDLADGLAILPRRAKNPRLIKLLALVAKKINHSF